MIFFGHLLVGHSVQVDVGLIRQQKLRPEEALDRSSSLDTFGGSFGFLVLMIFGNFVSGDDDFRFDDFR